MKPLPPAIIGSGLVIIGLGIEDTGGNSSSIIPPLPPQVDSLVHWLFGAGWWIWLIAAIAIVGFEVSKRGFRKEVTRDESKDVDLPSAEDYGKPEELIESPPVIDDEASREKAWREEWGKPNGIADPNMIKISNAFEGMKQKMFDKFVNAINSLEVTVTLPKGEPKIEVQSPTPPLQDIEE